MLNWLTGSFPNTHWKARLHGNYSKRLKAQNFRLVRAVRPTTNLAETSGPLKFFFLEKGTLSRFFLVPGSEIGAETKSMIDSVTSGPWKQNFWDKRFSSFSHFFVFSGLDQFLQKFDVNIHDRWRLACREKKQRELKIQFSIKRKFSWFSWKVQPPPTFANLKRNFSMKLVGTNKQVKKGLKVTWQLIHIIRYRFGSQSLA